MESLPPNFNLFFVLNIRGNIGITIQILPLKIKKLVGWKCQKATNRGGRVV